MPDRGTRASTRSFEAARALIVILVLGLALRLIIAYVLLPGSGFGVDRGSFQAWAGELAARGPGGFYERGFFVDYTPGYLYVLWVVGLVGQTLGGIGDLIKLPAILSDVVLAWLVHSMVLELGGPRRGARLAAILVLVNPVTWFDSAIWGQVDSFGVVFLLLALRELWRGRSERASVLAVVAAIIKPQLGILLPILAVVLLRRHLVDPLLGRRQAPGSGPLRLVTSGALALATAVVLCLPFGLSLVGLLQQVAKTAGGYPYLAVNAYNPWALVERDGSGLAANGAWLRDSAGSKPDEVATLMAGIPAVYVGTALLLLVIALVCGVVAWRGSRSEPVGPDGARGADDGRLPPALADDRRMLLVALTVLAIAFFVVPTRVHERYLFPAFALGAILAATSLRWRVAYVVLALASFANLYAVLLIPFYENPGVKDWLGIAVEIRSAPGVALVAIAHLAVFLWTLTELRPRAVRALDAEALREADWERLDEAGGLVEDRLAGIAQPTVRPAMSLGAVPAPTGARGVEPPAKGRAVEVPGQASTSLRSWLQLGEAEPALVPDRSRRLHGEGGGRLDRLDLWLLIVIVIAALALRTFRLAEPYRMHFDEVYHARTATEFLQDWRYGEPHGIYEFTHPHLAKYAIAAGLVVVGDDRVTAQRDLGTEVRDVLVEPRWEDPALPDGRAGDRFYVAGGDRLRAYDLQTRRLLATWSVPGASTLALDRVGHRVLVGTAEGTIAVLEASTELDLGRTASGGTTGGAPGSTAPPPTLATLGSLGAPIVRLVATDDGSGLVAATRAGDVVSLDPDSGAELARTRIDGAADLADGGLGDGLTADPAAVTDRHAAALALAAIISGDADAFERRLAPPADGSAGPTTVIVLGGFPDDQRDALDAAIADGRLAGFAIASVGRVAVAGAVGVTFVAPATGEVVDTVDVGAAVSGLAKVVGIDKPSLYAALADRRLAVVRLGEAGGTATRPVLDTTVKMPGPVRRVLFDEPTGLVHVLGRAPDGSADTIYVVEPHGNAVFADARLPFQAEAWAIDTDGDHPSIDRQEILVASAAGTLGAVDAGNHAFAWRLPGVIAGALMAGLVFLLVRMLFRRREIAVLAGILVLVDGMLFVQSRIAMNDVYVGLFIVAAYTLFAPLWTGRWRRPWAFWLVLPAVGLLLGLALAAKWVALYALAGIVVLILGRSALGRILLVLGLVLGTTVLGYMAMAVPREAVTSGGNLFFVALMIAITLAAVLLTVLHPIAWSAEEVRLAVGGPAALGIVVFLVALPVRLASTAYVLGPLQVTPLEVAFGLVLASGLVYLLLRFAGSWGIGPLAPPPEPDDPVRLTSAAPAPDGWLRPGSMLGLPIAWAVVCLAAIPLAVYVASYLPWLALGNRLTEHWPPGNTGQTLIDLTRSMYDYHNGLRATHAASSPFWAWPLDLKPVWFYQDSFGSGTAAAIYDAGNVIAWWLAIPAMAFVAWQAFRRRSLALGLVFVAFAFQWMPWARIDRATFQYHYYTALPFLLVALAYFLAELWNGASARTWVLARLAAAATLLGPALLWLFKGPLCAYARVEAVNPGSQACVATAPGQIVLTARVAGLLAALLVFGLILVVQLFRLGEPDREPGGSRRRFAWIGLTAIAAVVGLTVAGKILPETPILSQDGFAIEPIALVVLLALSPIAWVIATARDARRFVAGIVMACLIFFVAWYPNLAGLPLPSAIVNAYQGFLPTYLYAFQFPVNTDPVIQGLKLIDGPPIVLLGFLLVTCAIVGYSAWTWRIAIAERDEEWRRDEALAAAGETGPG